MLRISVITLIRTDTTLDLSQKAEKGKSPLRRPADESRFSGPQAMTLSRHFYDPGEGAAIGGSWRELGFPKAAAPHFRALRTAVGLPRRPFCSCEAALPRPELSGASGCPGARWSVPRHALGCPCALGCFRLAASLLYDPLRLRREV